LWKRVVPLGAFSLSIEDCIGERTYDARETRKGV